MTTQLAPPAFRHNSLSKCSQPRGGTEFVLNQPSSNNPGLPIPADETDQQVELAGMSLDQQEGLAEATRWAEGHCLVTFYVGLWWPVGFEPVARLTMIRRENVPWAAEVSWPDWFRLRNPESADNFVLASFYRHEHYQEFDGRIGLYAMELAREMVNLNQPVEVAPDQPDTDDQPLQFGRVPIPSSNTPATIVELMTPLLLDADGSVDPLTLAFNRCLEELNFIETAYLLASSDIRIRNTTRATCFPSVPYAVLHAETGELRMRGLLMVNFGMAALPYDVPNLNGDGVARFGNHLENLKRGNSLHRYMERCLISRRSREVDGDFASSLLHLYTAGEILFDTLLLLLAWEETTFMAPGSLSDQEVANWFSGNSTLRNRVSNRYRDRLRGGWNPEEPTRPLHDWLGFVSTLRNRTVHYGYVPKESEVLEADECLTRVEDFIKDMLCRNENRMRYPRTTLLIVAVPGLERRGLLTNRIIQLLQNENVDWLKTFVDWRNRVESLVVR